MNVSPVDELDHTAKNYAAAHAALAERVKRHEDEVAAITKRLLPGIKSAAMQAAQSEAELRRQIESNPELFLKPRTITLHGVKVGFQKGKGRLSYTDAVKVCELIRLRIPNEADALIKTTEAPIKEALLNLDVATLRKIGCTVEDSGDQVVIKSASSDIDRIVAKLLTEAAKAAGEEAA